MTVQVRPDYVNPLTMRNDRESRWKLGQHKGIPGGKTDTVAELQTRQQQLQSQMLVMKATGTDGAGATTESQKILKEKLEELTHELRAAKSSEAMGNERQKEAQNLAAKSSQYGRPARDWYEKGD